MTGASNPRDLLGAVIASSLRLGAALALEDWRLEMTPVDFVTATICHIASVSPAASDPDAPASVYHLVNPDPIPASEFFDTVEELGYPLERLPYGEWLDAVNAAPHEEDDPIGDILHGAAPVEEDLRDTNFYDDRNTRRVLGGDGLERPVFDGNLVGAYIRYFEKQGWVPRLQEVERRG